MPPDNRAVRRHPAGASAPPDPNATKRDIGRLLTSCPDRPGIVAAVSGYLFDDRVIVHQNKTIVFA